MTMKYVLVADDDLHVRPADNSQAFFVANTFANHFFAMADCSWRPAPLQVF